MKKNYTRHALMGGAAIFLGMLVGNAFGYLARLLLARNLTPEEYGLYYSIVTLFMLVMVLVRLGYNEAITRYTAKFSALQQYSKLRSSLFFIARVQLVLATTASLLLLALASWLTINYFQNDRARTILIMFIVLIFVSAVSGYFGSILAGLHRMRVLGAYRFLDKFLFFAFLGILLFAGVERTALLPALAFLLTNIVLVFIPIIPALNALIDMPVKKYEAYPLIHKRITSFALYAALASIGSMIIGYIDTLMLTYFTTLEQVGIYNSVLPTALLVGLMNTALVTVVLPIASELRATKDHARITYGLQTLYKYGILLTVPLALTLFMFPAEIINTLFGTAYVQGSSTLQILSLGTIFLTIISANKAILSGIGKPKLLSNIIMISALLNIVLNILLIPSYGIFGAAWATNASYLLILVLTTKRTHALIRPRPTYLLEWLKSLIAGLAFVACIWLLKRILHLPLYLEITSILAISGMIYLALTNLFRVWTFKELWAILKRLIS